MGVKLTRKEEAVGLSLALELPTALGYDGEAAPADTAGERAGTGAV